MYDMVELMRTRLTGTSAQVVGYGHLGDGNLHLNVWTPTYDKDVFNKIEPYLFEQTGNNITPSTT
jgi:D-2-hydroxyglutarate dehydrogenase